MNKKQKDKAINGKEVIDNKAATKKNGSGKYHMKFSFLMFPLVAMVICVPLMTGAYIDQISLEMQRYWQKSMDIDLYMHHSAILIQIIGFIMLASIFFVVRKEHLKLNSKIQLILGAMLFYGTLSILSAIFSENREVALWGSPGRYEGLFVHLGYMITVVYIILLIRNYNVKNCVNNIILFLAIAMSVLGISQMLGKDLLIDTPMFNLITMGIDGGMSRAEGQAGAKEFVSLTLGNPNYVGSYVALIIPLLLSITIDNYNSFRKRGLAIILFILAITILLGSESRAGLVGVVTSLIVMLALSLKLILKYKKQTITGRVVVVVGLSIMLFMIFGLEKPLTTDIYQDAQNLAQYKEQQIFDQNYGLKMYEFEIANKEMVISTSNGKLRLVSEDENRLAFYDEQGDIIDSYYNEQEAQFTLSAPFENIQYKILDVNSESTQAIRLSYVDSNLIYIENHYEEGLFLVDKGVNRIEFEHAPYVGFEGYERLGSSRGYIWSRSIPLLKNAIIKGYGPDNFLVVFPQHDYWAKTYAYNGDSYVITDKPHNMYLQWGINNGVIALLTLLAAFGIYIFTQTKALLKAKETEDPNRWFKIGILCSVIGYLATGMFNDSVVSVAPIFWSLFGLGVSMMSDNVE